MILVTVGTQLPFDRLVRAVDAWCAETGRRDVVGQIGEPGARGYRPEHFEWSAFMPPRALDDLLNRADLVIAHAGMGSIISALRHCKPIVIMPRRAALDEHRNEHQLATAARFGNRPGIHVAPDESQLPATLERALGGVASSVKALPAFADASLVNSLRQYILRGTTERTPARAGEPARSLVAGPVTAD